MQRHNRKITRIPGYQRMRTFCRAMLGSLIIAHIKCLPSTCPSSQFLG